MISDRQFRHIVHILSYAKAYALTYAVSLIYGGYTFWIPAEGIALFAIRNRVCTRLRDMHFGTERVPCIDGTILTPSDR